jgi:hypothetical protein
LPPAGAILSRAFGTEAEVRGLSRSPKITREPCCGKTSKASRHGGQRSRGEWRRPTSHYRGGEGRCVACGAAEHDLE